VAQRGVEVFLYSSKTSALERDEWSPARSGRTLPPEKSRDALYRKMDGPQGRSGRAENLAPPVFDPRTVHPAVSRYTDYATRPTTNNNIYINFSDIDSVAFLVYFVF
jgi:hypothetical protein